MASHPWQRNLIEARNFQGLCDVDPSIKDKLITRICNSRYPCNRSKPGPCRHLSFATNPVLNNFIGKIKYFVQDHISVPNYSERLFFEK